MWETFLFVSFHRGSARLKKSCAKSMVDSIGIRNHTDLDFEPQRRKEREREREGGVLDRKRSRHFLPACELYAAFLPHDTESARKLNVQCECPRRKTVNGALRLLSDRIPLVVYA